MAIHTNIVVIMKVTIGHTRLTHPYLINQEE